MYLPKHYLGKDKSKAIAFIKQYNFGTIITSDNNIPSATHLPFILREEKDDIVLISHFSKANKQWKQIISNENLIIFSEPHAYISPKNYQSRENVPTWNYISIHIYGKANIVQKLSLKINLLEEMIDDFEPEYKNQWNNISDDYKVKMANGIIVFEIKVNKLYFKEKLSQNKNENERKTIINYLKNSKNINDRSISEYMSLNEKM